jgi:hypothetical protein
LQFKTPYINQYMGFYVFIYYALGSNFIGTIWNSIYIFKSLKIVL